MKTKGIYFFYRSLQAFGLPVLVLYFLGRGLRKRAYYHSLWQRLGFLPRTFRQTTPGAIWLHAVSVGEVVASIELLRQLHARFPCSPLFVSTSTLAGRATAEEKLSGLAAGVFYAPVDYVFAVRRVLRRLQPAVVVVMETEIWPNLFREVKRIGCGLVMVNGRISDRAAPRYCSLAWFFRHVLPWADVILAQSRPMQERFVRIGAPAEKVRVGGNLKYDFRPREADPGSPVRAFLERMRPQKVWIAASTMPPARAGDVDEDDVVIQAYQALAEQHPGLLLLLAPRRPERFAAAAQKLRQAGVPLLRRSQLESDANAAAAVLLLDSIGELSGLFSLADVVFMGGSLSSHGGHNILEPAFFGRPIVIGPHMENFREISEQFRAAGACLEIREAGELAGAVGALLKDAERASELGRKAFVCASTNRGATARAVEEIQNLYRRCFPGYRPAWPAFAVFWPLSRLWLQGGRWQRARCLARQQRLGAAVISAGNLTMGGTGKTPFVLYLAEKMKQAGYGPGILTRGYGRHSLEKHLALEPGARRGVTHSGDEPQIFLRSGVAPVGIGPDRFHTGKLMEDRFGAEVLILDDGFQHLRLARQVDIVLIDALNPFGGGELFPLGRLREPLEGLQRADLLVLTRCEYGRMVESIERRLREYNPRAPIFHARIVPESWVEHASGRRLGPPGLPASKVGAFCGLGNPQSFWCTLSALGLEAVERVEFEDHHTYRPRELRNMCDSFRRAGAEAVVTTEKDMLNLCDDPATLLAPLRLYWLQIRMEIEREDEFLSEIENRLRTAC